MKEDSRGAHPDWPRVLAALHSTKHTSGTTHNFYLYPARFSPQIARAVVASFSEVGDWVLDPFMGGGTTIVEGLALGRRAVGVDLNSLAHFVSSVRTTPLSCADERALRFWVSRAVAHHHDCASGDEVINLPRPVRQFVSQALCASSDLQFPRQRAFARCALLRLGQWALDCRDDDVASRGHLASRFTALVDEMLAGLRLFVGECREAGVLKNEISTRRALLCGDASAVLTTTRALAPAKGRIKLVFTSPPYARVHVLYHRWQIQGRRETPAPYWIAQVPDGHYASHYTGGSRTPTGERKYFEMVRSVFSSVREVVAPDALIVQLVGFADVRSQYPAYMQAMEDAGLEACTPPVSADGQLQRRVPNRKWYAKLRTSGASSEVMLFHRPRQG